MRLAVLGDELCRVVLNVARKVAHLAAPRRPVPGQLLLALLLELLLALALNGTVIGTVTGTGTGTSTGTGTGTGTGTVTGTGTRSSYSAAHGEGAVLVGAVDAEDQELRPRVLSVDLQAEVGGGGAGMARATTSIAWRRRMLLAVLLRVLVAPAGRGRRAWRRRRMHSRGGGRCP